jgi:hypothetical protein
LIFSLVGDFIDAFMVWAIRVCSPGWPFFLDYFPSGKVPLTPQQFHRKVAGTNRKTSRYATGFH